MQAAVFSDTVQTSFGMMVSVGSTAPQATPNWVNKKKFKKGLQRQKNIDRLLKLKSTRKTMNTVVTLKQGKQQLQQKVAMRAPV